MAAFAVRRLLAMIIVLYLIATLVFVIAHAAPIDPVYQVLDQKYTPRAAAQLRHEFGLDQPVWKQYINYVGGLAHGDLGKSEGRATLGQSVSGMLKHGVPVTLKLGFYALMLALVVGLPVGLISAIKQNSIVDHGSQGVMIFVYAVPTFVLAPLAQLIIGAQLKWLPVTGWGDPGLQGFKEMILPVTIYAAGLAGYFSKSFRSFLLEVLSQDYIRTARAKGLKERVIIYSHAIKNTLLPLASIVGPVVAYLITGAFITETLFGIPGVGNFTVESAVNNDYPVVEATVILLAAFVVVVNFLTDIFYALVDPRVRL
jgi:peptide/nickel transport system permease protein/oligopeptide transport system permease protein